MTPRPVLRCTRDGQDDPQEAKPERCKDRVAWLARVGEHNLNWVKIRLQISAIGLTTPGGGSSCDGSKKTICTSCLSPPSQVLIWDTSFEQERISRLRSQDGSPLGGSGEGGGEGSDEAHIPVIKCRCVKAGRLCEGQLCACPCFSVSVLAPLSSGLETGSHPNSAH